MIDVGEVTTESDGLGSHYGKNVRFPVFDLGALHSFRAANAHVPRLVAPAGHPPLAGRTDHMRWRPGQPALCGPPHE